MKDKTDKNVRQQELEKPEEYNHIEQKALDLALT